MLDEGAIKADDIKLCSTSSSEDNTRKWLATKRHLYILERSQERQESGWAGNDGSKQALSAIYHA